MLTDLNTLHNLATKLTESLVEKGLVNHIEDSNCRDMLYAEMILEACQEDCNTPNGEEVEVTLYDEDRDVATICIKETQVLLGIFTVRYDTEDDMSSRAWVSVDNRPLYFREIPA